VSRVYDALRKLEEQSKEPAAADSKTLVATTKNVEQLLAVPAVQARIGPESRIVVFSDPRSAWSERFRLIRMALRNSAGGKLPKVLLVTSPLPKDGKSTVALNLATSLAEGGKVKLLLMEADLHRPTLSSSLGLDRLSGLSEVLQGLAEPSAAIRRVDPLDFYLLPSGRPPENPPELLQSERFGALLRDLKACFDCILIDCPPAFPLADVVVLKAHAEGVLLVARAGSTPREAVQEAIQMFRPGQVAGLILNAAEGVNRIYAKYYYRKDHSDDSQRPGAGANGEFPRSMGLRKERMS
jgi:capsular exopolysaccharide synthesis family protein